MWRYLLVTAPFLMAAPAFAGSSTLGACGFGQVPAPREPVDLARCDSLDCWRRLYWTPCVTLPADRAKPQPVSGRGKYGQGVDR